MSIEAGVLLDLEGNAIFWHVPPGRSGGALPDSRDLWEVFWENRTRISAFAHSHPGWGTPGPSYTDVTTFAAIEAALGKRLNWYITSVDRVCVVTWRGPERHSYDVKERILFKSPPGTEPEWLAELRRLSEYDVRHPYNRTKGECT